MTSRFFILNLVTFIIPMISCHPYVKMFDDAEAIANFSTEAQDWVTRSAGQIEALRRNWDGDENDQYPHIIDPKKKVIGLNNITYSEQVVDYNSGNFVSDRAWFIIFIHANQYESNMHQDTLQKLAHYFDGAVQFAYIAGTMEEEIAHAYDAHNFPRMFYIDQQGMAYAFYNGMAPFDYTKNWIENRDYTKSPWITKAPAALSPLKLKIAYVKKEVRKYYIEHFRDTIEKYLRQYKITYLVDMDPYDFENIKLNQKTNRQILFIFAGIVWVLETLWDVIAAKIWPAQEEKKKKPKSFLSKKKKKAEKEEEEKEGEEKTEQPQDQAQEGSPAEEKDEKSKKDD